MAETTGLTLNLIVALVLAAVASRGNRYPPTLSIVFSLLLLSGLLALALVRRHTLSHIPGAETGTPIDPFRVVNSADEPFDSRRLLARPAIVLLLNRSGAPSVALAAQIQLAGADREIDGIPLMVVRLDGRPDANDFPVINGAFFANGDDVAARFGITVTPHAFLMTEDHVVRARLVPRSLDDLRRLATESHRDPKDVEWSDGKRLVAKTT